MKAVGVKAKAGEPMNGEERNPMIRAPPLKSMRHPLPNGGPDRNHDQHRDQFHVQPLQPPDPQDQPM